MKKFAIVFAAFLSAACSGVVDNPVAPEAPLPVDPSALADLSGTVAPGEPGACSVMAGFASTRTHLQPSADRNTVKVFWNAGDTFDMMDFVNRKRAPFSTEESGDCVEFTTMYVVPGTELYSFYPSLGKWGFYNSKVVLEFNVPVNQTAIAGGLEDSIHFSYACSSSMDEDLHFHNIPSLLRFRMTGSVVQNVKSVTVKGGSYISGDFVMSLSEGNLSNENVFFGDAVRSNTVTLTGDFTPGEDYYIAVIPKSQTIQLVFSDADGNTTTKMSSKQIQFSQGKVTDIGTIDLGDSLEESRPQDPVLYMEASSGYTPVSIAVIPEGFRESEMADYTMLARSAVDAIMATEPFKTYRNYFNVWILYANSRDSGASVTDGYGTVTAPLITAFGAAWGEESYGDMSANDSEVFDFVSSNCPDIVNGIHTIDEVPVLMLINDDRYGGMCWSYQSGRAYAMVPYTDSGGSLMWGYPDIVAGSDSDPSPEVIRQVTKAEKDELGRSVGDWRNTAIHEFGGHCFSRLLDEYWYSSYSDAVSAISRHTWTVPFGLNISATYNNPPWQDALLDNLDYLVSLNPLYSRVGVFQGGDVSALNRWRSEKISCMIDNRPYFSTWQRILAVKRIMSLAGAPFSLSDFFARDVADDPVRDAVSSPVIGNIETRNARLVPPLPPPVLID